MFEHNRLSKSLKPNAFYTVEDQYVRMFEPLANMSGIVGWCAVDQSCKCLYADGALSQLWDISDLTNFVQVFASFNFDTVVK